MTRAKPSIRSEVADLVSWVRGAACKDADPQLFEIPDKDRHGEWSAEATARMDRAKEICIECPVMMRCLEHAVTYDRKRAIYGGMNDDERAEWLERETAAA